MRAVVLLALASCISKPDRPTGDGGGGSGSGTDPVHWVKRDNASQPGMLESPRLAYDPTLRTVVLWSGSDADKHSVTSMWSLGTGEADAATGEWTLICSATSGKPCAIPERWRGGFAATDQATYNFGGASYVDGQYQVHNDVWKYSVAGWMQVDLDLSTANNSVPAQRDNAQMVWDPDDSWFYVYGGAPASAGVNDLWTLSTTGVFSHLNGTTNGGSQPGEGPVLSGQGQEIAYDTRRKRLLTLVDNDGAGEFDELWSYSHDSDLWSHVCTGCTGFKREFASLIYVPTLDATLFISGQPHAGGSSNPLNTTPKITATWMLQGDATVATQLDTSPIVSSAGVAYDPNRDVVVLYGGDGCDSSGSDRCSNTWELVKP